MFFIDRFSMWTERNSAHDMEFPLVTIKAPRA
uniref:Uncharacterized protein n=1 Tax=Arundo donax TaxID=35708 RepID=A0A0A9CJP1_ARUDO